MYYTETGWRQSQITTHVHLLELKAGNQRILSCQEMLENIVDSRFPKQARLALLPTRANDQNEDGLQQRTTLPISLSSTVEPSPAQAIIFRTFTSKYCGSFCSCTCHRMKKLRSPSLLDHLLGSILIGYEALPLMDNPCSLCHCRRVVSRTVVSYMFPRWFLNCVVLLETRPPTPELVLRIFRIRPDYSEVFVAVIRQDISRIRRMIADGTASVRDVNEKGETLISVSFVLVKVTATNTFGI